MNRKEYTLTENDHIMFNGVCYRTARKTAWL